MTTAFNRNIKALRLRENMTQPQFAESLDIDPQTAGRWERYEIHKPRSKEVVERIKTLYKVTDRDLFGFDDGLYAKIHGLAHMAEAIPGDSYAPVMGNIAAGDPREAIEFSGEQHYVAPQVKERYPHGFFLIVAGDSMNKILPEGSYAYIADAEHYQWSNGDIVAVKVNGDDATIKRITTTNDIIILEPESTNPQWNRIVIDETNPDSPYVRVLGKVVWYDMEL